LRRRGFALAIPRCKLRTGCYGHCHIRMPAMSAVSEDEPFLRMNARIREVAASLRMAELGAKQTMTGHGFLPLRGHFGLATPRTGIDARPPTWQLQR
jgi:hypothetical protein